MHKRYTITTEFLGTADDRQVEEEIATILKNQFLLKIVKGDPLSQTILSNPLNKEVRIDE